MTKTFTLFSSGRGSILELCRIEAATLDEAARSIDCRIAERGDGTVARFRPHFIGATECATLTATREMTRESLLKIAKAAGDDTLQLHLRSYPHLLDALMLGDIPTGRMRSSTKNKDATSRGRRREKFGRAGRHH